MLLLLQLLLFYFLFEITMEESNNTIPIITTTELTCFGQLNLIPSSFSGVVVVVFFLHVRPDSRIGSSGGGVGVNVVIGH